MKEWMLGHDGFIMEYMIAGPKVTPFKSDERAENQLELEARLRAQIVTPKKEEYQVDPRLGQEAENGCRWSVWAPGNNCFIDVSHFYSTLQSVSLLAAVNLNADTACEVQARVWTYMAVGIYCNGKLAGEVKRPVYKPIQYQDVIFQLNQGKNLILCECENLGVRDTRNIVGIQIVSHREHIKTALPDDRFQEQVFEDTEFMRQLCLEQGSLVMPEIAGAETSVCFHRDSPDYEVMCLPQKEISLEGKKILPVPEETALISVIRKRPEYELSRELEFTERRLPCYPSSGMTEEENWKRILKEIASVGSLNRGKFGFAVFNILARKQLGIHDPKDRQRLFETLDLIEERVDCSDFLVCGLIRYMHLYEMDEKLQERTKQVLLNYRYWMDMDGADAMCFWSENHSLMFYSAAMEAGKLYPEEYFPRAGMKGEALQKWGRSRLLQWLDDTEEYGFEEFLSTVYMCVTFAALLNVIDFAEKEISDRARALEDRLVEELCTQTFKGSIIAPMGRVYREVIYPFCQGAQSLINRIDPEAPWAYGEGWLGFLSGSTYRFPQGMKERMKQDISCRCTSGNAAIVLEKTQDYCLTSVESPRADRDARWENIRSGQGEKVHTHAFTKSLNECFHGTSAFGPGIYGYQQHMWYGALSPEAVIFANHPGATSEQSDMRPGYWYGNGVMPAVKQVPGKVGAVYRIPESHPIHFTHIYCPRDRFDRVLKAGNWLLLKKDTGYMGLWCSTELTPFDDTIFHCELRAYGDDMAYLCVCGSTEKWNTLEEFGNWVQSLKPSYCRETGTLKTEDGFELHYQAVQDDTQYLL